MICSGIGEKSLATCKIHTMERSQFSCLTLLPSPVHLVSLLSMPVIAHGSQADQAYTSQPLKELPNITAAPQNPMAKFDPSLVNPHLPTDPNMMGFDAWEGSDYSAPPLLDQFPDYDWAAGLDFSTTEFPTIPIGAMNPMMPGPTANMGYTFG